MLPCPRPERHERPMMKTLDRMYSVDFDHRNKEAWYELMNRFQDANLYQAWSYDVVRYGPKGVSHMVLRKGREVVAAAQARIHRVPRTSTGIAYVFWGPMWRLEGAREDREDFRQAVRALRNELSLRRGLVLRLYPLAFRGRDDALRKILLEEGYHFHDEAMTKRTLIIDLEPSLKELRAGLHQKWRNGLNRAERNRLELISGEDDGLFDEISEIYSEMANRKGLHELSDLIHLKSVQKDLPGPFKLKIILCRRDGVTCAGGIFAAFGATGVYLIGATSGVGLKTNGSYAVQWAFVKWLKENGFRYYDLNGINPETNPGTYHFKQGLAGKGGADLEFLGKYQVADNRVSSFVVGWGERALSTYRWVAGRRKSKAADATSPKSHDGRA